MGSNPFAAVAEFWSPLAMKVYIVLMIVAVVVGVLFDVWHKGSGIYFAERRKKSRDSARNPIDGGKAFALVLATVAEAAGDPPWPIGQGTRKSCRRSHWNLTSEERGKGKIPC